MISKLATKYCKNKLFIYTIRPFWRMMMKVKKKHQQRIFRKHAHTVLSNFAECCNKNNIPFWLEFGTLLGVYRDNGFIPHDFDLDLAIFYKDAERLHTILTENGFKLLRKFEACGDSKLGLEFTYEFQSVPIDIFIFHQQERSIFCHSFTPIFNESNNFHLSEVKEITFPYEGIQYIDFEGISVGIPKNITQHLILNYGDNFMIPDKNFDYKKVATNIKYFSRDERMAKLTIY